MRLPARCRYPHSVPGTYYDHLNIKRTATHEAIEETYRQWRASGYKSAKAVDPVSADAMDRLIVDARNVLSNEAMRKEYDQQLPAFTTPLNSPSKPQKTQTPGVVVAPSSTTNAALPPGLFDDIWR